MPVERLQVEAPPALVAVGARELAARQRHPRRAQRLGREHARLRAHERQAHERRVEAVDEIERDLGAEARGADAESRVAQGVADVAGERRPEEDEEAAAGVDRAAPAVREADPLELRERLDEVLGEQAERRVALVEVAADAVAPVVDRVVAAVEDAVVGRQPEVVELVAAVGQALPVAPSRATAAASPRAARSSARSRRPAACAGESCAAAADTRSSRARPAALARGRPGSRGRRTRLPGASCSTGEPSQMRTPSSSSVRRSP